MALSAEVISVQGLRKEYATPRGEVLALDRIDFTVGEGEFVAIVGPSGCGKSTLLKILAGLLPATNGRVQLRGTPITGPRRDIGMVFQSPVLFPWRTVLDNVLLPVDVQRLGLERRETVLFITHSIAEAVFLADRVLIMTPRPGHIAEEVPVRIPRPRSLDMMGWPEFSYLVRGIRAHFNAKGGIEG